MRIARGSLFLDSPWRAFSPARGLGISRPSDSCGQSCSCRLAWLRSTTTARPENRGRAACQAGRQANAAVAFSLGYVSVDSRLFEIARVLFPREDIPLDECQTPCLVAVLHFAVPNGFMPAV